jgi:hypothetical protein
VVVDSRLQTRMLIFSPDRAHHLRTAVRDAKKCSAWKHVVPVDHAARRQRIDLAMMKKTEPAEINELHVGPAAIVAR